MTILLRDIRIQIARTFLSIVTAWLLGSSLAFSLDSIPDEVLNSLPEHFIYDEKRGEILMNLQRGHIGDWFKRIENGENAQYSLVHIVKTNDSYYAQWAKQSPDRIHTSSEGIFANIGFHRRYKSLISVSDIDTIEITTVDVGDTKVQALATTLARDNYVRVMYYSGEVPSPRGCIKMVITFDNGDTDGFSTTNFNWNVSAGDIFRK